MWVRMRMSLSLSVWAVHGSLWPADSRWDGDTGGDSDGDSDADTARCCCCWSCDTDTDSDAGTGTGYCHGGLPALTAGPIHSCKLNSVDHESVSP